MFTLKDLEKSKSLHTITIPLIAPTLQEVLSGNEIDFSKSSLNACYSKNSKNGKAQSWFDVQLTINNQSNLPSKEEWFYVVTDDGYLFKGRFVGQKVKWLSSFENKKFIGTWIKGRLVDLGFVSEVKDMTRISHYPKGYGIITSDMLEVYGGNQIFLKKIDKTKKDKKGIERSVWLLSFPFTFS